MVLEEPYWDVLKKQGFVRTAAEEERKRFQAAEVVSIPQEHFAKAIARLLRAALASCPQNQRHDFALCGWRFARSRFLLLMGSRRD